jgi:hypothetical protein
MPELTRKRVNDLLSGVQEPAGREPAGFTVDSCLLRKAFNSLEAGNDVVRSGRPRQATANPQAIDANDDTG